MDLNTICECGHPFREHAHNRKGSVGECLSTITPDGKFCKCKQFRAVQSTKEATMKKAKKQKAKKAGTPRVGSTVKPKSNLAPALARFTDQITVINAIYKEKHYSADVLSDGMIRLGGGIDCYRSPSAAAMAITDRPVNGWTFWTFEKDGKQISLDELRGNKSPLKAKSAAA